MKKLDGVSELLNQFTQSGEKLLSNKKPSLRSFGRALTVTMAMLATSACVAPPSGPDRPGNTNERVFDSAVMGAILGVAARDGNTKENAIAGVIGAVITGGMAYSNSKAQEERNRALREAGIQAIEMPGRSGYRYRDETSVLLQMSPYATHKPGAGKQANLPFSNSMIAIANAIDQYPIDSYRDVEVIYAMREGCSQEAREQARVLQAWLHKEVDLPVGVSPIVTRDGTITYDDAVSQTRGRTGLMSNQTGNRGNFSVGRGGSCETEEGSVNVVVNGLSKSR